MASFLENALASDEYAASTGLDNPLERPSWRDNHRPDYETEPDPVTLGEDGNYYANDNRWNYGEWVTSVGDEPVYWVVQPGEMASAELDHRWEYDEYGNVITKDADYMGGREDVGGALNPVGRWMSESEMEQMWEEGARMKNFKRANPDMTFDDYLQFTKDTTALQAQGIERLGEGGVNPEYQAVYDKYGIQTKYEGKDGAIYEWNGGGYTKTVDGVDKGSMVLNGLALGILGAGLSAGLAPVLSSALGAAGSKAASSAIINLTKQYLTTGNLSFEDALMSAALSYGGSELSSLIEGSGVVGDLASKFNQLTGELTSNGGDILKAALSAGGMSLVTQLVQEGEIDWKDAALAAAMAGGTTALQGFLADIGKPDAQDEVLQEISVDAQHKGEQIGENLWRLEDGTVISVGSDGNGNVLGNMSDLDLDGDGMLNANDLQGIDVSHDYVDESYTPYQDAYAGKNDVYVDANGRPVDPVGVKYSLDKDGFVDGNGNLVTKVSYGDVYGGNADLGPVDNQGGLVWESHGGTDGVVTFEDGRFYAKQVDGQWIGADGQVIDDPRVVGQLTLVAAKAIDDPLNSVQYFDQDGNPINYKYPPAGLQDNYEQGQFSGLIFGPNGEVSEVWYDPITNTEYIKAQGTTEITAIRTPETPPEPVDPQDPDQTYKDSTTDNSGGDKTGGGEVGGTKTDSNTPDTTGGISGGGKPGATSYTVEELVKLATDAGTTVLDVINRLNNGETAEQILKTVTDGDTSVDSGGGTTTDDTTATPTPTPTPNSQAYEDRIAQQMARYGLTREQAIKKMAHAVALGADLDGDGIVYDEEWRQWKSANTDNDSDTDTETETDTETTGANEGDACQLADGTAGTIQGGVCQATSTMPGDGEACTTSDGQAGTIQGGVCQANNIGGNDGDACTLPDGTEGVIKNGQCTGTGDGSGDGDGTGDGLGLGNGNGFMGLAGAGGGSSTKWSALFAPTPFQKHSPYQSKVTRSLFGDLMSRGRKA